MFKLLNRAKQAGCSLSQQIKKSDLQMSVRAK